ncbi:hypothetical protein [Streptomyces sp. F63]|uniref:hypothetical protein n=1 Tax=Streptomyces sp. F63 TaxID=2824887 RepID=UPI0035B0BB4C
MNGMNEPMTGARPGPAAPFAAQDGPADVTVRPGAPAGPAAEQAASDPVPGAVGAARWAPPPGERDAAHAPPPHGAGSAGERPGPEAGASAAEEAGADGGGAVTGGTEGGDPDAPAGPAPLGVPRTATGHAGVDAALDRLADADHLPGDGHLEVYEDVHRVLRDTLTALDRPPGPPGPSSVPSPVPSSPRPGAPAPSVPYDTRS